MKQNKVSRLLALLLSSAMVLSMAGCGSEGKESVKESNQAEKEQSQTIESSTGESVAESEEEAPEPVTFTLGVAMDYWILGAGNLTKEQPVLQWLADETGVEIEFITYDQEKLTMMIAGGDLADIMVIDPATKAIENLVAGGQIIALDDLVEQYGSTIESKESVAFASSRIKYGNGEVLYGIPTRVSIPGGEAEYDNTSSAFRVRYDVWKAIGSPEYSTIDEAIDVLKQMQEYERERLGKDDIYALSVWMADWFWSLGTYAMSRGYYYWDTVNYFVDYSNGEVQPSFANEDSVFWECIEFYNKAYREGILDPESLTQDITTMYDKCTNGKCLALHAWQQGVDQDVVQNDEAIFMPLPFEPFNMIQGVYGEPNVNGGVYMCISENCEDPERAMQFIDFLWTDDCLRSFANGVKGVHWDYAEDGEPEFIGDMAFAWQVSKEEGTKQLNEVQLQNKGAYWFSGGSQIPSLDGKKIPVTATDAFNAQFAGVGLKELYSQDWGYEYPGQAYDAWIKEGRVTTEIADMDIVAATGYLTPASEEAEVNVQNVYNYFLGNIASAMLAETEEDFEAAKAKMIDYAIELGIETYDAEIKQIWENAKAIIANSK